METFKSLKKRHPQKYNMKLICELLYFLGTGDSWYEPRNVSKTTKVMYKIWEIICNAYSIGVFIDEMVAHTRTDLSVKEKNDLNQFSFGHPSVLAKLYALYFLRDRVKVLMRGFLENKREYTSMELDKAAVKKATTYCLIFNFFLWSTLSSAMIDAIRVHLTEGIPIRAVVVYFPNRSHSGFFINILRFFIELHWYYICMYMTLIDGLCILSLVYLAFRFKFLQQYFKGLREKFLENPEKKSQKELEDEFQKGFIIGIELHENALWCARHVQHALGNLYSIQVVESILLLIITLIKLVSAERNLLFFVANLIYITTVICATGLYMMAGGDITYEASMVSTAIYHSGWELSCARREMRTLVVMALMRSQVPVHMTAFGVVILSYDNFISVLRSSYSFFAVMY